MADFERVQDTDNKGSLSFENFSHLHDAMVAQARRCARAMRVTFDKWHAFTVLLVVRRFAKRFTRRYL